MKKILVSILSLCMAFTLFGCQTGNIPVASSDAESPDITEAVQTASAEPKTVSVRNIDELLAAIAPNTTVQLSAGNYDIQTAENYGKAPLTPYYYWETNEYQSYELQLQNLTNFKLIGAGNDQTNIQTNNYYAFVMVLQGCESIEVSGITFGHTVNHGLCMGGVLHLKESRDVDLNQLGLYGCGSVGIHLTNSSKISIHNNNIYDCSYSGINTFQSSDIDIYENQLYTIGKDSGGISVFSFVNSNNITVRDCSITDCFVNNLISDIGDGDGALFTNCNFNKNFFIRSVMELEKNITLDKCNFDENKFRLWYAIGSQKAYDLEGNEINFEAPVAETVSSVDPSTIQEVSTGKQTEVTVKTPDEFLRAIANNTCIILDASEFDLSTAAAYGKNGQYYYWEDNFDGPSLVITNVKNLTIRGASEDKTRSILSAVPRYANVLTFENCEAITLKDFTAGHTIEPGYCLGGVIMLRNCQNILSNNCGFFGCGTIGIYAEYSLDMQFVNNEIYQCSYNGIALNNSNNVVIAGNNIHDCEDYNISLSDCENINYNGVVTEGYYYGD